MIDTYSFGPLVFLKLFEVKKKKQRMILKTNTSLWHYSSTSISIFFLLYTYDEWHNYLTEESQCLLWCPTVRVVNFLLFLRSSEQGVCVAASRHGFLYWIVMFLLEDVHVWSFGFVTKWFMAVLVLSMCIFICCTFSNFLVLFNLIDQKCIDHFGN